MIRSGRAGLGVWRDERRDLHADALRYFGAHPGDAVRVWLIACNVFKRQRGNCVYADIRLSCGARQQIVL